MATLFGILAEQLGLQREYVVEDTVDPPPFQPVVRDYARVLQVSAQRAAKRPVDAGLAPHLRVFEKLEASVQGTLPRPVGPDAHSVPSTSTRPAAVTRTFTLFNAGSAYCPAG